MMSSATIFRISFVLPMLVLLPRVGEASPSTAKPVIPLSGITVSFKLDPRVVDPTHGGTPWISPVTYAGAYAQDTVEARAQGVDASGRVVGISARWIVSDPAMVKVSPTEGNEVRIVVKRGGASTVKVVSGGVTQVLEVQARYQGKFIQVAITQLRASKPPGSAPTITASAVEGTRAEKQDPAVMSLPGGLRYKILKKADGPTPTEDDIVECRYRITTSNGQEVGGVRDSDQPVTFGVAEANWKEALKRMPLGSRWLILVPARPAPSADGPRGRKHAASKVQYSVPLVIEVELLAIKRGQGEQGRESFAPDPFSAGISL